MNTDCGKEGARSRRPGASRALSAGIVVLGILAGAIILGLVAWQALQEREDRIERERDSLARLAGMAASDMATMLDGIVFFFKAADLWLVANPDADPRFDPRFAELVAAFKESQKGHVDIRLVSEEGGLFYIPSKSRAPLADVKDRDYYKAQLSPATRGLHIADPVLSRVTHLWGLPISYPLANARSGIAVIFAAIELPSFAALYESIRPKPGGSVTLIRRDGLILARSPFDAKMVGRPIAEDAASWRSMIDARPVGSFVVRSVGTDGAMRVIAYDSQASPSFVVSVSAKVDDLLAGWRASLPWKFAIALATAAALATFSSRLLRALRSLDEAQAELRGNVERLRLSDATKDKLFSIVAHDLRGPIGGIASLAEAMAANREAIGEDELGDYLEALRASSANSVALLENLLAWARSQRGELHFDPARVALAPAIRECAAVHEVAAAEKGIAIELEVAEGIEATADPDLLRVLLRNLISNAVKFTSRGGRVRLGARRSATGATIEVADDGIGIPKEALDSLFDLGKAGSRLGTANERGTGLGLVLCKDIAERHGGSLYIASEEGRGSSFSAYFPD